MAETVKTHEKDDYSEKIQEAILNFEELKNDQVEKIDFTSQLQGNHEPYEKLRLFENIKFSGQNDTQHPKIFIRTFEKTAIEANLNESEKQYYFIESLVDDAEIWLKDRRFGTYEDMKNDFLNFYWSLNKEQSFLDHLDVGKYDKNCGLAMTEYFIKYFNWAVFSEMVFTEKGLISDLLQHFDFSEEVETAFGLLSVKTYEEAVDALMKIDAFKSTDNEESKSLSIPKKSRKSKSNKKHKNIFSLISIWRPEIILPIIIVSFLIALCAKRICMQFFFADDLSPGDNQTITNIINEYSNSHYEISHYKKCNPFQTLKFSGRPNAIHPKSFIQNFEHIAAEENLDSNTKKYYFIQSLVEDAQDWLITRGYGTYEEMKEALLEFYWSPEIQKSFLDYLIDGKYDEESGLSPSGYFYKYVNEAKFLDNAPSEEKVICYLLKHFNLRFKIWSALKVRPIKTLEEALGILANPEVFHNYFFYKYRFNIMIGFCIAFLAVIAECVLNTSAYIKAFNYFFDICKETVLIFGTTYILLMGTLYIIFF